MAYDLSDLKILSKEGTSGVIVYEYEKDKVITKFPDNHNSGPWLVGQIMEQNITSQLINIDNKTYCVPRIIDVSKNEKLAVKSKIFGEYITKELFDSLNETDKQIIRTGIANLLNDMNQMRQIKEQKYLLNNSDLSFDDTLKGLSSVIPAKILKKIDTIYKWFDKNHSSIDGASVVFSHTDLYEKNILWDKKNKTVGILDFAESDYKDINEIMDKLFVFGSEEIKSIYEKLPKAKKINFYKNEIFSKLLKLLQNFYLVANAYLKNKNTNLLKILMDNISNLYNYFDMIKAKENLISLVDYNSVNGQRGRGAIGPVTTLPTR